MSNPFVAEIRVLACNFPPKGWAFCNGQLMPLSQNTALFSLLGTTYGGDGKSTFGLPDMQGNAPMHWGQSTTGSLYDQGEINGTESVALLETEIPGHTHSLMTAASDPSESNIPTNNALGRSGVNIYSTTLNPVQQMHFQELTTAGGGLPHNNMMPYLTLNFCLALQGVFPQRP